MSTAELLDAYRASRDPGTDTSVLCHAPFVSLNFEQNGQVTTCCFNRKYVLGVYPQQSVRAIWEGAPARAFREAFLRGEEAHGCDLCFHQLENRNFGGALMRNFDRFARNAPGYAPQMDPPAPRVLEFEIANTCNLECVMCAGHWSSAIRAHREKLPPLESPYDDRFVEQLEDYLPAIAAARFLGGEPFLIKRYYAIWERLRAVNPEAELSITTNGSLLPERARELLEGLRCFPVVSLDSLDAATFERIRLGARFEAVLKNLHYLIGYARRRGTSLSLAVCPMRPNWRGLPDLLAFCEREELYLHFNMVLRPAELSLASLPAEELERTADHLAQFRHEGEALWTRLNRGEWDGLVSQLRSWSEQKRRLEQELARAETAFRAFAARHEEATRGWTEPDAFERLAAGVVRSLGVAREREKSAHPDLQVLLPAMPLTLAEGDGATSVDDLLLATHLLCRFADAEREPGSEPDDARLGAEQRRLREYLAQRRQADPPWVNDFAAWLKGKLERGEAGFLVSWMNPMLRELDDRGAPKAALAWLRERGLEPSAEKRVMAFFAAFVTRILSHDGELRRGDRELPWLDLQGYGVVFPRIEGFEDLGRVFEALHLFHCAYEPSADHEAFRRRLDRCLEAVKRSEKLEFVCRSLESADANRVYDLLAHASDDALDRALEVLA